MPVAPLSCVPVGAMHVLDAVVNKHAPKSEQSKRPSALVHAYAMKARADVRHSALREADVAP